MVLVSCSLRSEIIPGLCSGAEIDPNNWDHRMTTPIDNGEQSYVFTRTCTSTGWFRVTLLCNSFQFISASQVYDLVVLES